MSEPTSDPSDELLSQRLAAELPRHAAPARLRVAIVAAAAPPPRRPAWLAPLLAASATALALGLFGVEFLPRTAPMDPTQVLVRGVINEHSRALMWGARRPEIVPAAVPWLTEESGVTLARVFAGDDRLEFVAAEPVYINRTRGVALHYRDVDGHLLTYIALPAPKLSVPDRQRVQAGRFRPALMRDDSGFVSLMWKQGELACFLVSDMVSRSDVERFKDYFVRVRNATEPAPAN